MFYATNLGMKHLNVIHYFMMSRVYDESCVCCVYDELW